MNDDSHSIQQPVPAYIDDCMTKAYGSTSLFSDGGDHSSPSCQRWKAIEGLMGSTMFYQAV